MYIFMLKKIHPSIMFFIDLSTDAASKHAFQAFFDSLRAELADTEVHVCVVSPGYISTNLSRNALNADGSAYGSK